MDKVNLNKIIEFVKRNRWDYSFELNENTRLYEDLGIYGDEASSFFIEFGNYFNVDVSKLELDKYFKGEGLSIFSLFKKRKDNYSLTLGCMVYATKKGALNDTVINQYFNKK